MPWTYTTKELVSGFAKVPEGELRDAWSNWVEDLINQHVGTSYTGTVTYTNEMHDGDGGSFLFVNHPPIVSVSALSISGGDMIPSDYKVYESFIELVGAPATEMSQALYRPSTFPVGAGNVLISYIGLSAAVPARVQLAGTQMVSLIALVNQREGADASLKYSKVTQTQGDTVTTTGSVGLQSGLMDIMKRYLPPK